MDSAAFSEQLSTRVMAIRAEQGDTVSISDVANLVEGLMVSLEGDISASQIHVQRQVLELVEYIKRAREEIASLQPQEISDQHIPAATDELTAIVDATEEATNSFLDAAEKLGELGTKIGGEDEEAITEIITQIFEASNFQDITGQRINKVVSTLQYIEGSINKLAEFMGTKEPDADRDYSKDLKKNDSREDADLLNGPQMEAEANSQDDIDALMESFD
jgi:chemotaxis protein CheZ